MGKKKVVEEKNVMNDKGFAIMYNITMITGIATVAMFVLGTALYIAVVG